MDVTKPRARLTRKTILPIIGGVVVFFLYILLFQVDIREIMMTVQRADVSLFSMAIVVSFTEVFFSALLWRALLNTLRVRISIARSFLYTWYSIFIDTLIPAEGISGEVSRVYLVNQEQNGISGKTVASVVIQRIIGMGINAIMLIVSILVLLNTVQLTPLVFQLVLLFSVVVTLIIGLLLLVSWKEKWSERIINGLVKAGEVLGRGRWKQKLAKIKEEAGNANKMFHESMKEFGRNTSGLILPTIFLILNWISSLAVPYLVFLSLGFHVSWAIIFIVSSIVIAIKSIPIGIPFEVGLPEMTMTTFYTLMGIPAGISATATILIRILTLWLRFGIGFAAQQWIELKHAYMNTK